MALFASDYQGGPAFEVFSAQGSNPLANWKVTNQKQARKVYDKEVKGYVYTCSAGPTNKLQLPKEERKSMTLLQPFLVLQGNFDEGVHFSLELSVTDKGGTRRRLFLSSSFSQIKSTPLHCQVPFAGVKRGTWTSMVINVADLVAVCFPGQVYGSMDLLILSAQGRLRKVFTLRQPPPDTEDGYTGYKPMEMEALPRALEFPLGVECTTQVLNTEKLLAACEPLGGGDSAHRPQSEPVANSSASRSQRTLEGRNGQAAHLAFGSRVAGAIPYAHSGSAASPVGKGGRPQRGGSAPARGQQAQPQARNGSAGAGGLSPGRLNKRVYSGPGPTGPVAAGDSRAHTAIGDAQRRPVAAGGAVLEVQGEQRAERGGTQTMPARAPVAQARESAQSAWRGPPEQADGLGAAEGALDGRGGTGRRTNGLQRAYSDRAVSQPHREEDPGVFEVVRGERPAPAHSGVPGLSAALEQVRESAFRESAWGGGVGISRSPGSYSRLRYSELSDDEDGEGGGTGSRVPLEDIPLSKQRSRGGGGVRVRRSLYPGGEEEPSPTRRPGRGNGWQSVYSAEESVSLSITGDQLNQINPSPRYHFPSPPSLGAGGEAREDLPSPATRFHFSANPRPCEPADDSLSWHGSPDATPRGSSGGGGGEGGEAGGQEASPTMAPANPGPGPPSFMDRVMSQMAAESGEARAEPLGGAEGGASRRAVGLGLPLGASVDASLVASECDTAVDSSIALSARGSTVVGVSVAGPPGGARYARGSGDMAQEVPEAVASPRWGGEERGGVAASPDRGDDKGSATWAGDGDSPPGRGRGAGLRVEPPVGREGGDGDTTSPPAGHSSTAAHDTTSLSPALRGALHMSGGAPPPLDHRGDGGALGMGLDDMIDVDDQTPTGSKILASTPIEATPSLQADLINLHRVFTPPLIPPSKVAESPSRAIRGHPSPGKRGGGADVPRSVPSDAPGDGGAGDEEDLDLMYDPILNCYYDPKTNRYYELKT